MSPIDATVRFDVRSADFFLVTTTPNDPALYIRGVVSMMVHGCRHRPKSVFAVFGAVVGQIPPVASMLEGKREWSFRAYLQDGPLRASFAAVVHRLQSRS